MSSVPTTDPIIDKAVSMARRGFSRSGIKTVVGNYLSDDTIRALVERERAAAERAREVARAERMLGQRAASEARIAASIEAYFREVPLRGEQKIASLVRLAAVQGRCTCREILGGSRVVKVIRARHHAMYMAAKETGLSLPAIARIMGGKDHTGVLHGIRMHCLRNGLPMPRRMKQYEPEDPKHP